MITSEVDLVDDFVVFLRDRMTGGMREPGISEVLRPFAIQKRITFEAARDVMYRAISARRVHMTDNYKLKPIR